MTLARPFLGFFVDLMGEWKPLRHITNLYLNKEPISDIRFTLEIKHLICSTNCSLCQTSFRASLSKVLPEAVARKLFFKVYRETPQWSFFSEVKDLGKDSNTYSLLLLVIYINPFQFGIAFHPETSHLFYIAKPLTDFYMKYITGLK